MDTTQELSGIVCDMASCRTVKVCATIFESWLPQFKCFVTFYDGIYLYNSFNLYREVNDAEVSVGGFVINLIIGNNFKAPKYIKI